MFYVIHVVTNPFEFHVNTRCKLQISVVHLRLDHPIILLISSVNRTPESFFPHTLFLPLFIAHWLSLSFSFSDGFPWFKPYCLLSLPLFSAVDASSRSLASRERVHKSSVTGPGTALSSLVLRQKGG